MYYFNIYKRFVVHTNGAFNTLSITLSITNY